MNTFTLTSPSAEADARARETDGDERGDSPTARGVWGAIFEAALVDMQTGAIGNLQYGRLKAETCERYGGPIRALSLMAGYGSDASELRRLAVKQGWPIRIAGVELCEARRPHLDKWCDEVDIIDWPMHLGPASKYDIIVSNPDFSHILRSGKVWSDTARSGRGGWVDSPYLPAEQTLVPTLLEHAPAVLLLHRAGAFDKSVRGREVLRLYPPAASWRIGPASFSGDGKCDSACYLASLWLRGHEGPTAVHTLRELTASERGWTVPPGSETPSADLPAQPGWSP